MDRKIVKLGVVGLGRGAYVVKSIVGEENVVLRAICDHNESKLEQERKVFVEQMKVENLLCFHDFDEMLKSDIDAVYVATDAIYHVPFVKKAMEAGKHVISEIPTVNSLEEAKELRAVVKSHPELKYMAGENCCYWAFIDAWKRMYEEGKFGEAIYVESEYIHGQDYREYRPEDFPPNHWRTFNPAIKYLTHNLGPLLYILNDKCVSVTCMVPDVVYNPYVERPKNGVALFKTEKGAVIRILICFDAYVGFDHNFALIGTRGTIETDKVRRLEKAHSFARFSDVPGSREDKIDIPVTLTYPEEGEAREEGHGGADKKMMMAFVNCILEDTDPPIDVDLGIRMALPGIIADLSSRSGGELMDIPDVESF